MFSNLAALTLVSLAVFTTASPVHPIARGLLGPILGAGGGLLGGGNGNNNKDANANINSHIDQSTNTATNQVGLLNLKREED